MDELQILRTRVGEMAAEIERLQSVIDEANAQEPVVYLNVDTELGYTFVDNGFVDDLMDGKHPLYAAPVPAQQSPAALLPDGYRLISNEKLENFGNREFAKGVRAATKQTPRITEQDARSVLVTFLSKDGLYNLTVSQSLSIENWISTEGRVLLDKLNGVKNETN